MDKLIYTAASGARHILEQQATTANNLANVGTNGFKKSRAVFEDLLYQNLRQPGAQSSQQTNLPSGMQLGTGVRPVAIERIHTQGNSQATGNDKDMMVSGNGFFNVLLPDGTTAYTRDGSFQLDSQGRMVNSNGLVVQGGITVPANAEVQIASDGTVSATVAGARPQTIGRLKLVTPEQALTRGNDGLFRGPDGDLEADATARLQDGVLEGSNVSPVETMVAMITAARQFEQQMKLMQTSEKQEQAASKLLSNAG